MKPSLKNNWPTKLASLLAAFAIWFLIKQHIGDDSMLRFAGFEAEGEKFRSQLGRDQIRLQELLEQANEIQKRINENLLNNAPKATPVTGEPPPPPTAEQSQQKPNNNTNKNRPADPNP
jgi:hypothetical protein